MGVVLYEMVAGRPPFAASDNQAAVWAIQFQEPEPLTALRSGVPLELERITQKAMARNLPPPRSSRAVCGSGTAATETILVPGFMILNILSKVAPPMRSRPASKSFPIPERSSVV